MSIIITRYFTADSNALEGGIANVFGPFADDDKARDWAEQNIDSRTVWTVEDLTAPFFA